MNCCHLESFVNSLPLGHLVSLGVLVETTVVYVVYAARSKVWITRYPMKVGFDTLAAHMAR